MADAPNVPRTGFDVDWRSRAMFAVGFGGTGARTAALVVAGSSGPQNSLAAEVVL